MLRSRPLTDIEVQDIYETSKTGLERMKARVVLLAGMTVIMLLIYPYQIIVAWYFPMMLLDFINFKLEKRIIHTKNHKPPMNSKVLHQFFMISWAESLCMVALAIALSIHEGQIPHFTPYLILLCTSIYIATSTFHNAVLMFGHLTLYNLALLFIGTRDVVLSYPNTEPSLWVQFFASIIIALFLTDSYKFFRKIHLAGREKSKQVEQARKRAEMLTLQKSDLISAIGHELRTPLNGILGFSQVLKHTKLTKKQQQYVGLVEGAGKDLQLLLSNILDGETLEQGLFHLHPQDTDIHAFLMRILKSFETAAAEKGIYLKLEVDAGIQNKIRIDPTRLGQCLSNLLSNAVRFTKTGGITVTASTTNADKPTLIITVADTGIGIPQDQTSVIFEKFGQGEDPSNIQSGLGLGLWLVRSIASAMNGKVSLTKTSAEGSTFMLMFELDMQDTPSTTDTPKLSGLRVLHIEDTPTNLMLIRVFLESEGIIVTEARTGRDAIDLLSKIEFDAVLCDLQLPDSNGNQLLDTIRSLNTQNAYIPVIALTAQPEKIRAPKQGKGFCAILAKPIDRQLLISTLTQTLKNAQQQ